MITLSKATLIVALGVFAPTFAAAQDGGARPAPQPVEMAAELGVSATLLQSCAPEQGQPGGAQSGNGERPQRPSREEHEARLTEMASCLQQDNAAITAQSLDEVMQKYRPAAPDRG
ncbi:hypothetical protein SAMN04488005_2067 [Yoonia tamlensis]|uniref:Uncharacterized protein n=1 Tax=Yoonia tamlensis TaxID=390270 RepID=A0A1I6GRK4_9RHOB|nr:hypothetical protein [Yoonia tamlensis]SFR44749.1 hypothetical protein SAMN04488005_2067 [Yoonia tamlensis]